MEYSPSLHQHHDSYPLAPENVQINGSNISDRTAETLRKLHKDPDIHHSEKLVSHLGNRTRYKIHSRNAGKVVAGVFCNNEWCYRVDQKKCFTFVKCRLRLLVNPAACCNSETFF